MQTRVNRIAALAGVACVGASALAQGSDQSHALRAELSADALSKTQYMEKANGFTIAEGDNKLKVGGWFQFRYFMNFRDNPGDFPSGAHDSGFTNGFEFSRMRLNFTGNVLDPNLKFKFEGDFNRGTGEFLLLDAFGTWAFKECEGLTLKWGQFKGPLLREELMSDTAQLAIERSVMSSTFSQTRTQGVNIEYLKDSFRGQFSVNDGMRALNTNYASPAEKDIGLTARAEFKFGEADWKLYDDFTSFRGQKSGVMLGLAGNYQHDGNTANPGSGSSTTQPQTDQFNYTADFSVEGGGWNAFVAGTGQHFDGDNGSSNLDDFGLLAQAGVMVSDHDEVFGRWDLVLPDDDRPADEDFNTLTAGWNHYFIPESHALKLSADFCWFLDDPSTNALVSTGSSNGLLRDNNDNQFEFRFQLQMMF
ncbi:MAG: hypothetical protein IT435_02955 [Phycisphaerales bacterium]|nr:hypothetical protein [Phycisphaerales bacterium]